MRQLAFAFAVAIISIAHLAIPDRAAAEDVMIVLDASGSMWGRIDGKPKISIAREVMSKVLSDLDGKANIGVITYGHRKKGECSDIESIIPVGKVDQQRYMAVINQLSPKGKTPISDAVAKAADELRFTEEKATVVLISDGLETCNADPCALAQKLEKQGIDFTVHVVGFDLKGKDTSSLQCLARETGGRYLAADNADELGSAIGTVVATAPTPEPVVEPAPEPEKLPTTLTIEVLLAEGSAPLEGAMSRVVPAVENKNLKKSVSSGMLGKVHKLEPGKYYIQAHYKNVIGSTEIEVKANAENHAVIILNAGLLSVDAVPSVDGEPIAAAYITISDPTVSVGGKRKKVRAGNQRLTFAVPAGTYFVSAKHGDAHAGQEVEIIAGQKTDAVIVLAAGVLKVQVLAQEGGKPQTSGVYVYVYERDAQVNGKRKRITGANPRNDFSLPAGEYFIEAQIGKAKLGKDIEVVAGERAGGDDGDWRRLIKSPGYPGGRRETAQAGLSQNI